MLKITQQHLAAIRWALKVELNVADCKLLLVQAAHETIGDYCFRLSDVKKALAPCGLTDYVLDNAVRYLEENGYISRFDMDDNYFELKIDEKSKAWQACDCPLVEGGKK